MSLQYLSITTEDGVSFLSINRPPVNALSNALLDEIGQAMDQLNADPKTKVIVFVSAIPNVFIAGVDLKEMAALSSAEEIVKVIRKGQGVFSKIEDSEKPVIAAIHGACLGGGQELVLACHLRIASDRTRFAQPEVLLGIIPGFGGSQRLPRIVGPSRAAELILTGDAITPQEALRIGLVNRVVSDGALVKTARELGKKIAKNGLPAIRAAMRAMRKGLDKTIAEGMAAEEAEFGGITRTHDMREGIQAFLEKRQPKFTDS